jgi:hypothetical protein
VATLAVSRDFFADYSKLEKCPAGRRRGLGEIRRAHPRRPAPGEADRGQDPRIRTIRITRFWRGVVLAPERGDFYCLLRVVTHDTTSVGEGALAAGWNAGGDHERRPVTR